MHGTLDTRGWMFFAELKKNLQTDKGTLIVERRGMVNWTGDIPER